MIQNEIRLVEHPVEYYNIILAAFVAHPFWRAVWNQQLEGHNGMRYDIWNIEEIKEWIKDLRCGER